MADNSIILVGNKYVDIYTIEAGRGATARAELPGGIGIVEQLFGKHAKRSPKSKKGQRDSFGKRISLSISMTPEKRRVVFADSVSVVFRDSAGVVFRGGGKQGPASKNDNIPEGMCAGIRVGFYALPDKTEGELDRIGDGRRFPGLGSLFHAYLLRDVASLDRNATEDERFEVVFEAAKAAVEECKKHRDKGLLVLPAAACETHPILQESFARFIRATKFSLILLRCGLKLRTPRSYTFATTET